MIKNILQTVGTKVLISASSFVVLLLNSNFLGAEGLGTVGLLVLSITIVLLISNLVHTGIIYFASRFSTSNLFLVSYLWSIFSLGVAYLLQKFFGLFPEDLANDIYYLSFLQSAIVIHMNILLGKEKIQAYNLLSLGQSIITLSLLVYFFVICGQASIDSFVNSLYIAYLGTLALSFFSVLPQLNSFQFSQLKRTFVESIRYGFHVQSANIFQLLNYRISYFILDAYAGRASLGMYSAGVQLSEALLLPGKSISTVQYARISARKNEFYAQRISILFMKISVALTGLGLLVLLLIPDSFFTLLLGNEFAGIKLTLFAMSLGILALSAEIILSHYFSGTGRQQKNSESSLLGFVLTLSFSFLLIPSYGAIGAALSSSIAFTGMLLYLIWNMIFKSGLPLKLFFPNRRDFQLIKRILRLRN